MKKGIAGGMPESSTSSSSESTLILLSVSAVGLSLNSLRLGLTSAISTSTSRPSLMFVSVMLSRPSSSTISLTCIRPVLLLPMSTKHPNGLMEVTLPFTVVPTSFWSLLVRFFLGLGLALPASSVLRVIWILSDSTSIERMCPSTSWPSLSFSDTSLVYSLDTCEMCSSASLPTPMSTKAPNSWILLTVPVMLSPDFMPESVSLTFSTFFLDIPRLGFFFASVGLASTAASTFPASASSCTASTSVVASVVIATQCWMRTLLL